MSRVQAKYRELVADGAAVPVDAADEHDAHTGPHVVPLWLLAAVLALYWLYDRLVGIDNLKLG